MNSTEYKPNSYRSKAEQAETPEDKKRVEKVVTGNVKTKKKNEISKFASIFVSEDIQNVKTYVFSDVLVPAIKKAISDVITNGIDMLLYGGTGKGSRGSASSKVSYRSFYDKRDDSRSVGRVSAGSRFDFDDLIFESRGDAEMVRDQLDEMIDRYGVATVADYYDAANITAPYTSNKYGWTNIRNAEVQRVRDGYVLRLPRAMPID